MQYIQELSRNFFVKELEIKGEVIREENCFFEVSKELFNSSLKTGSRGVLLGCLKKDGFVPTQYFLEQNKDKIKNYVIIKEESEFLFTCGRDLFKKSVIEKTGSGLFVVFNKEKEVLGLVKEEKGLYKNVLNIGLYLKEDKLGSVVF